MSVRPLLTAIPRRAVGLAKGAVAVAGRLLPGGGEEERPVPPAAVRAEPTPSDRVAPADAAREVAATVQPTSAKPKPPAKPAAEKLKAPKKPTAEKPKAPPKPKAPTKPRAVKPKRAKPKAADAKPKTTKPPKPKSKPGAAKADVPSPEKAEGAKGPAPAKRPGPHAALSNPVGEPDPTEWPDPYDRREDPRGPEGPAQGAVSTSEPHPDPELAPDDTEEKRKRDKLDR